MKSDIFIFGLATGMIFGAVIGVYFGFPAGEHEEREMWCKDKYEKYGEVIECIGGK